MPLTRWEATRLISTGICSRIANPKPESILAFPTDIVLGAVHRIRVFEMNALVQGGRGQGCRRRDRRALVARARPAAVGVLSCRIESGRVCGPSVDSGGKPGLIRYVNYVLSTLVCDGLHAAAVQAIAVLMRVVLHSRAGR